MPKTNLQQQAVSLIEQLSAEKLKMAVDYLTYLYDKELWETKQEFASVRLGAVSNLAYGVRSASILV